MLCGPNDGIEHDFQTGRYDGLVAGIGYCGISHCGVGDVLAFSLARLKISGRRFYAGKAAVWNET